MPRLFTGLEIPQSIAERLTMLSAGLPGARWIDPENYHITLRFIGDVDDIVAHEFASALAEIRFEPFDLQLDGLGSFGGKKPRAIWAGIAPSEPLLALQRAHEGAARAAGLPPEPRNFTPHLTLARLRDVRPQGVADYIEANGLFLTTPFRIERFALFSARASRGGGPYVVEDHFPPQLEMMEHPH